MDIKRKVQKRSKQLQAEAGKKARRVALFPLISSKIVNSTTAG